MDKINCWICETEMRFIDITEAKMIKGKVKKYKCPKCDEVVYRPINK